MSSEGLLFGWFLKSPGKDGGRSKYPRNSPALPSVQSGGHLSVDMILGGDLKAGGSALVDGGGEGETSACGCLVGLPLWAVSSTWPGASRNTGA